MHNGAVFPDGYFPNEAVHYVRLEFECRMKRRPHYSLRAFARDLQMSPAALSEFLRGKAGLSGERALFVAKCLGLDAEHTGHFRDLIVAKHARAKEEREAARLRARTRASRKGSELALDRFQMISDWYHLAFVELVNLDPKYHSESALARALGLSRVKTKAALSRLERVELLDRGGAVWKTRSPATTVGNHVTPSAAIRAFHGEVLGLAQKAIDGQDMQKRNFESGFMSIRSEDLPELKSELQRTFKQILNKYHQRADKDALYALSFQLFRLDQVGEDSP